MAGRPDRSSPRRRNDASDERRGTLVDSLSRTPAAPRTPARANRYNRLDYREPSSRDKWDAQDAHPRYAQREYDDGYDYDRYDASSDAYTDEYRYGYAQDEEPEYAEDDDYGEYEQEYEQDASYDNDWNRPRSRERSQARPLTPALTQQFEAVEPVAAPITARVSAPVPVPARVPASMPARAFGRTPSESFPALAAYRPVQYRVRLNTQRLVETARNPWTIARLVLALTALLLGIFHATGQMGEHAQPLMLAEARAGIAPGSAITALVRPETQLLRPDLYDNVTQFNDWGGAACSAAALSEILTAYGVPNATIGHEIDELGSYISPNGGLLSRHGFVVVAAKHNLRADESTSLSYNQLVYITEQLGMPVIVNVRISYGYYHFFDGGHFLTVVGGDAQGLRIVDSSEYYIHYLPKDVFYQMFTGYTAAIVPASYQYTLPSA